MIDDTVNTREYFDDLADRLYKGKDVQDDDEGDFSEASDEE